MAGGVDFTNFGYGGVPVYAYTCELFLDEGNRSEDINLSPVGATAGTVYTSTAITTDSNSSAFSYHETIPRSPQSPDRGNAWYLVFAANHAAGEALLT
jgi:predicted DNA binding protein